MATKFNSPEQIATNWTNVTFNAGNFTANGSMTWTVTAPEQLTYRYAMLSDKLMLIDFFIAQSSTGGTASNDLRLAIPNSKLNDVAGIVGTIWINDGTNGGLIGYANCTNIGQGFIQLRRADGGNWQLTTNNTYASGKILLGIQ